MPNLHIHTPAETPDAPEGWDQPAVDTLSEADARAELAQIDAWIANGEDAEAHAERRDEITEHLNILARFAAEDAAEAYADEPYATGPAPASAPFPAFARQDAVEEDGAVVLAHLVSVGVSFNARAKVNAAETYTLQHAGSSLAIPSKLSNTTVFTDHVEAVESAAAGARFYPTVLYRTEDFQGRPQIIVLAEVERGDALSLQAVGYLQDKHARWIAPLLDATLPVGRADTRGACPVKVYLTAFTGGTAEKPSRGVNVVICGTADAIRTAYDDAAQEDARERAYQSGIPNAVEAAL